ncbi:MAG: 2-oxoacid:acceptor oxidoreductase family protein [Desulfomonilaceae bacterium]
MMTMNGAYEIIWHGRGGQGAVTAAKILTEAAFYEGFKGVSAKPAYFSERRGAPVAVHTRISQNPVRSYSNVAHPDIAVVLDDKLLGMVNVTSGLKEGGLLIINSTKTPQDLGLDGRFTIAITDAFHSSEAAGLIVQGNVLISTSILGPFIAASNLITLKSLEQALRNKFNGMSLQRNIMAVRLACQDTHIYPAETTGMQKASRATL